MPNIGPRQDAISPLFNVVLLQIGPRNVSVFRWRTAYCVENGELFISLARQASSLASM